MHKLQIEVMGWQPDLQNEYYTTTEIAVDLYETLPVEGTELPPGAVHFIVYQVKSLAPYNMRKYAIPAMFALPVVLWQD